MKEMKGVRVQFLDPEDPLEEGMALQEYSFLKNLMERGALASYGSQSCTELDMTEATQHAHSGLQFRKLYEVDIIKAGSTRMCSL